MNKQRIKTNAINTATNVIYYGGTLGTGVTFYQLLDQPDPLGIVIMLVLTLVVEGILRTLLAEFHDAMNSDQADAPTITTTVIATSKETGR
ncbi:hypothetical protein ACF1GW_38740 [Streptomyces achromogenes]|uniref:hypothetical protein n=1 Tax=Streptomyces achromogenes TaxID=67255 RepID=UPI0036F99A25